ncbi:MAG: 2TM domain-containing protein [Flavobacterium sp.]
MERNHTEEDRYLKVKKRVGETKIFYKNLVAFITVNGFFVILNLATSPKDLWFYWPMLGWGIGVVFHGFSLLGKGWEERKMEELLIKEKEPKRNFK